MGSRIAVLKDGLLQQIDTPQVLYDTPDNVFVAGFIGSPSMNFFDATLVQEDGQLLVDTGSFRIQAPESRRDAWSRSAGQRVVLGVRPEDIHDSEYTLPGITAAYVDAEVDVTELMGNEILVYFNAGKSNFIARIDPRSSARIGMEMQVVFNADNMHLFDAETEQALR